MHIHRNNILFQALQEKSSTTFEKLITFLLFKKLRDLRRESVLGENVGC